MTRRLDSAPAFPNRLKEFRIASCLTVAECASRCNVQEGAWYRWERGGATPSLPYLWLIENLLDASYRDIWHAMNPELLGLEA